MATTTTAPAATLPRCAYRPIPPTRTTASSINLFPHLRRGDEAAAATCGKPTCRFPWRPIVIVAAVALFVLATLRMTAMSRTTTPVVAERQPLGVGGGVPASASAVTTTHMGVPAAAAAGFGNGIGVGIDASNHIMTVVGTAHVSADVASPPFVTRACEGERAVTRLCECECRVASPVQQQQQQQSAARAVSLGVGGSACGCLLQVADGFPVVHWRMTYACAVPPLLLPPPLPA